MLLKKIMFSSTSVLTLGFLSITLGFTTNGEAASCLELLRRNSELPTLYRSTPESIGPRIYEASVAIPAELINSASRILTQIGTSARSRGLEVDLRKGGSLESESELQGDLVEFVLRGELTDLALFMNLYPVKSLFEVNSESTTYGVSRKIPTDVLLLMNASMQSSFDYKETQKRIVVEYKPQSNLKALATVLPQTRSKIQDSIQRIAAILESEIGDIQITVQTSSTAYSQAELLLRERNSRSGDEPLILLDVDFKGPNQKVKEARLAFLEETSSFENLDFSDSTQKIETEYKKEKTHDQDLTRTVRHREIRKLYQRLDPVTLKLEANSDAAQFITLFEAWVNSERRDGSTRGLHSRTLRYLELAKKMELSRPEREYIASILRNYVGHTVNRIATSRALEQEFFNWLADFEIQIAQFLEVRTQILSPSTTKGNPLENAIQIQLTATRDFLNTQTQRNVESAEQINDLWRIVELDQRLGSGFVSKDLRNEVVALANAHLASGNLLEEDVSDFLNRPEETPQVERDFAKNQAFTSFSAALFKVAKERLSFEQDLVRPDRFLLTLSGDTRVLALGDLIVFALKDQLRALQIVRRDSGSDKIYVRLLSDAALARLSEGKQILQLEDFLDR